MLYRPPVILVQPRARPWSRMLGFSLSHKARGNPCLTLIRPEEATTIRRDPLVARI